MTATWQEMNWQYLLAAIDRVRGAIEQHSGVRSQESGAVKRSAVSSPIPSASLAPHTPHPSFPPPALTQLCTLFRLSPFEQSILLACTGAELDAQFGVLCAEAQGNSQRDYPTLHLLLTTLPQAHWNAFTPKAPLRRWRLIDVEAGRTLTHSPVRIDERILHYLLGEQHLDDRLQDIIQPIEAELEVVPSHQQVAAQIVRLWTLATDQTVPIIQLYGSDTPGKRSIAATAANLTGRSLYRLSAQALPTSTGDLTTLALLWEREALLSDGVLLIDCDVITLTDATRESAIAQFIERIRSPLLVSSRDRDRALFTGAITTQQRPLISLEVDLPTANEQRILWQTALGETSATLNGEIGTLTAQFNLNAPTIHAVCAEARSQDLEGKRQEMGTSDSPIAAHSTPHTHNPLWDLCRLQSRPEMDDLAQRIEAAASWDDLVLPEAQCQVLRSIAAHTRQRTQVYEQWGFGTKGKRGLGISALFAGASGTGKTMAAEVLAETLRLDLYRIDLSSVVSKYIGETEKNLRRIFDAAESGAVILLFDEADALFGKRSEVKDSHDRYANMEVSYLLQRIEAYQGLAILTTNMKESIDTAFLRRIRFIVKFPFPDAPQREEIWRRVFPVKTPVAGIDVAKLARLNVAGGNIRNIALNAAFLAADAGEPVTMQHLREAALSEYAKLERTLTDAEVKGWV